MLESRGSGGKVVQAARRPHVVALDYGMKWNIPRHLVDMGCRVTVLPGTATADDVLALKPDGVFLSNGPGDPEPLDYAIETIRGAAGQEADLRHLPGAPTAVAGLRGQDVQDEVRPPRCQPAGARSDDTGRVEITSQNHGFAVDEESLPDAWK